jgi:hypothetical protein
MATRSIKDEEIALIKAMLARGMRNKDIQFHFNRPERPVNNGRITGIRKGTYSNSSEIPAASDDALEKFFASQRAPESAKIVPTEQEEVSPLSQTTLMKMFHQGGDGVWRLTAGETDCAECKENFQMKHSARWLRPMAALANNRGGYIFFGIKDQDAGGEAKHEVVGMANDEFIKADPADLAKRVKSIFDPTPRFQTAIFEVGGFKVGVIHVEPHPSRPVVATKTEGNISEGDIFFRYPGISTRIKYSDLRSLLDARDTHARADILPMVVRLLRLGPGRAMIADLDEMELTDGKRAIQIDQSLINQISFKEGEFIEKSGSPALRLVGDVTAANPTQIVRKGVITRADMLQDFLADKCLGEPLDYIRFAVESTFGDWLPIRYFARKAGLSDKDLIAYIDTLPVQPPRKDLYRKRLASPDTAYAKPSMRVAKTQKRILDGEAVHASDTKAVTEIGLAIQGLNHPPSVEIPRIGALLTECLSVVQKASKGGAGSATRRAIARLDELLFSNRSSSTENS